MALIIPITGKPGLGRSGSGAVVLLVILDKENLERMRAADPFDVQAASLGPAVRGQHLEDLDLVIAYEEEGDVLVELARAGKLEELIAHVERGRRHRPEKGDATKPVSLRRPGKD